MAGADAMARGMMQVQQAGVELDAMAMQALESLPPDHAAEMLEYVADNHTYLRNPSKYITSTVSRGFVPRRSGAAGGEVASAAPKDADAAALAFAEACAAFADAAAAATAEGCGAAFAEGLRQRAGEIGLVLSDEAVAALATLSVEHAEELLSFVFQKHGELRDPSNYIASTIARGFKSRRDGPPPGGGGFGATNGAVSRGGHADLDRARRRVREAGIELDAMALQAVDTLPLEHALEILEYVAENHMLLRNPSNYITSTVARGFVSRKTGAGAPPSGPLAGKGAAGAVAPHHHPSAGGAPPMHPALIPPDVTPLEKRLLQINSQTLAATQQIDFQTYLALRCVPQWQAEELLHTIQVKATVIANPCNYIQAAVTKIQRGQGWSTSGGRPGEGDLRHPPGQPASELDGPEPKRQRIWG